MPPSRSVESHHFEALGTSCSVFGVDQSRGRLLEGEFWVRRLGARLTRFSADSELSRLNAAAGEWMEVSKEMESLLKTSLEAFEMSSGLVNVAVLQSMIAIGYRRPLTEGTAALALEDARPLPALPDVLVVRPGAARLASGVGIDLGGIAKGWMADRLCAMLGPNSVSYTHLTLPTICSV